MIYETPLAVSRDKPKEDLERIMRHWTDGSKHVIMHYLEPIELRSKAACVGTNSELKQWVRDFPYRYGAIYVVAEGNVVYDMDELRPELVFYHIVVRDEV